MRGRTMIFGNSQNTIHIQHLGVELDGFFRAFSAICDVMNLAELEILSGH